MLISNEAKTAATGFVNDAISKQCLYSDLASPEDHDWSRGSPESLYSIAMLTINDGVEGVSDKVAAQTVIEHLEETFPQYVC
jgi:hypothetical protein